MADDKPANNYYQNLGGVNQKSGKYMMSTAQFLNLRNLDFDAPNALQKRPGSTQAVAANTTGPINSIFEFVKLDGTSFVIAGSDTAMFYLASNAYTLLSPNWTNGQPTDMLTFVNKLWMANGQHFQWWDGVTLSPVGLPCPKTFIVPAAGAYDTNGASIFLVSGFSVLPRASDPAGGSFIAAGVYLSYSFIRQDGYQGPIDFLSSGRNMAVGQPFTSGSEYFDSFKNFFGVTSSNLSGISGLAIWAAADAVGPGSPTTVLPDGTTPPAGNVGYAFYRGGQGWFMSETLKPDADITRFHLAEIVPAASLFLGIDSNGATSWGFSLNLHGSWTLFSTVAGGTMAFSGMPFCFFDTNTPKYIEIDNNIMFMSGFSAAPSTVWFSDIGAPESIQPTSSFEVRTNDGDRILAMKPLNDYLVILKARSFDRLIGDNPDNFQLVQISNEYGCLSNKAIIEIKQKLLWLDQKGILEFNGASYDIISGPVELVFRRMNLTAAIENACAVHHLYRSQVWFGIPVDGSTKNNLTIVYDYAVGAWTFFDGFSPSAFEFVKSGLTKPTAWRGDYSGLIHYFSESLYGDNGIGITCLAQSRFENFGGENQTTIWRRFFLDVVPVNGFTGVLNGQVFSNYDAVTVQATFTMYQNQFQSRAEMGVVGKAMAFQISHASSSLPLLLNGYSWEKRGLRNV